MSGARDQARRALVLEQWRSGRRSTEEIARETGMAEEDVCRILEEEGKIHGFSNTKA